MNDKAPHGAVRTDESMRDFANRMRRHEEAGKFTDPARFERWCKLSHEVYLPHGKRGYCARDALQTVPPS